MDLNVLSLSGKKQAPVNVDAIVGKEPESKRILHEVLTAYMGNQRRGTSATKSRGMVSGGGRKPWKQKGTGNARSGSIRSPLWRGGGIIFGPHPRSYRIELPKDKKREALRSAFLMKANNGELSVLSDWPTDVVKTKQVSDLQKKLGIADRVLFVFDVLGVDQARAYANLAQVTCETAANINALQLMRAKRVLFTQAALDIFSKRVG